MDGAPVNDNIVKECLAEPLADSVGWLFKIGEDAPENVRSQQWQRPTRINSRMRAFAMYALFDQNG